MTYNPNIPQPSDNLSDSQNDLLNNFQTLDTSFAVNHYQFSNATANNGKHKFCEMPIGILPVGLSANEATIYGKSAVGLSPATEGNLWFTPDASGKEYQLTRTISDGVSYPKFGAATTGWTFLPGGLIMQYGTVTTISGGGTSNGTVIYPITFTSPSTAYSINLTVRESSNSRRYVKVATSSSTGFTCWVQSDSGSNEANVVYWVAIGK
jgi:hypothetical protein